MLTHVERIRLGILLRSSARFRGAVVQVEELRMGAPMSDWLYVNHVSGTAKLHRESCGHCNYGHGTHGVAKTSRTGFWVDVPSDDKDYACAMARYARLKMLPCCAVCGA